MMLKRIQNKTCKLAFTADEQENHREFITEKNGENYRGKLRQHNI